MAIDFLGKNNNGEKKAAPYEIKMHKPEEEIRTAPKKAEKPVKPPKITAPKPPVSPKLEDTNLIKGYKRSSLKRKLTFAIIFVIIILEAAGLVFWFLTRPKPVFNVNNSNQPAPVVNENVNINLNTAPVIPVCGNGRVEAGEACDGMGCNPDQICENCQCAIKLTEPEPLQPEPVIPPPPLCGNGKIESGEQCDIIGCGSDQKCEKCQCQAVILPDTELAPLRGALVKFSSDSVVYLVEYNGELRPIDVVTVSFKNGQTFTQISKDLIYMIAERFQTIRRGRTVKGEVNWDPRILSSVELIPFQ